VTTGARRTQRLIELLALSDDELCAVLDVDALGAISGAAEEMPHLAILIDLLEQAAAQVGAAALARWVRASGPAGKPIDLLTAREFAAFERSLELLAERGIVVRSDPG
jgi:hypothetical protein